MFNVLTASGAGMNRSLEGINASDDTVGRIYVRVFWRVGLGLASRKTGDGRHKIARLRPRVPIVLSRSL
jgi:hypothetical protein